MKGKYLKSIPLITMMLITSLCTGTVASAKDIYAQDLYQTVTFNQESLGSGAGTTRMATAAATGNPFLPDHLKPSTDTTTSTVTKTPVYKKDNFPEMRRALENLFDSYVTETGGFGPLYTGQVFKLGTTLGDGTTSDPTFAQFMGTKYSQQYLAKQGMTQELANLAKLTFKDIKGTEWYSSLIPLSVYYGVVNGYEDGTFRGNQAVTRAELAVMICNYLGLEQNSTAWQSIYGNAWYAGSLRGIDSSVIGPDVLNKTTVTQAATRGEVATVLAKKLVMAKYTEYIEKIEAGQITSYPFSDIKGYTTTLMEDYDNNNLAVSQFYSAYQNKMKNASKPPKDVLAAMLALNDLGIMQGDSNRNSNWTKPVTRAEILAFIQKAEMQVYALTK